MIDPRTDSDETQSPYVSPDLGLRYHEAAQGYGRDSRESSLLFEQIWRAWYGRVEDSLVRHVLLNDVEWVTADTFIRLEAWLYKEPLPGPLDPLVWHVRDIARAEYWRGLLGRSGKTPVIPLSLDVDAIRLLAAQVLAADRVETLVEHGELADWVRRVLNELSPSDRAILVCRWLLSLSVIETGRVLEISGGAVKMRTARARRRFARKWQDHEETQGLW